MLLNPATQQSQWLLTSDVFSFRSCGHGTVPANPEADSMPDDTPTDTNSSAFVKAVEGAETAQPVRTEGGRQQQQQQPFRAVASGAAGLPVDKQQLLDAVHDILAKVFTKQKKEQSTLPFAVT